MTSKSPSLEERFALHKQASTKLKTAIQDMGLGLVTVSNSAAANGMTAVYTPEGITPGDIVPKMLERGVVIAAGLHKGRKNEISFIQVLMQHSQLTLLLCLNRHQDQVLSYRVSLLLCYQGIAG